MNLLQRLFEASKPIRPFQSEANAYRRLRERGLAPDAIVDVGAYEGGWTRAALTVWPGLPTLMIEPQVSKQSYLEGVCREYPSVAYSAELLASEPDLDVIFYEMETGSSIYPENSNAPRRSILLRTRTLDSVAQAHLGEAIFLKIDAQGAELDILRGGARTMGHAAAIQLELPIVHYNKGAPNFVEILNFMDKEGFAPVELSNATIIKNILLQIDVIFVKKSSVFLHEAIEF